MRKRGVMSFIIVSALIPFIFTGCAKREEAKEEPKEEKVVREEAIKLTTSMPAKREVSQPAERQVPSGKPITEEMVLFSFEHGPDGWEVPDWALEKDDHVAENVEISKEVASEEDFSLRMNCDFPGGMWTAAVAEIEQYFDFSPYREIAVDVYVPKETPLGLRGKIILTVGEDWKFTEMSRSIPLVPGEWVTIRANIEPGSYDWKRRVPDESFRQDVRKIVMRIESNRRPVYKGPVYIDNMRLGK